jgi:peptide/nickel transport system ATP-binding protein
LLLDPEIIIADEPTTALDVTTQAEIMDLLLNLCEQENVALMLITHDLGVVSQVTQRMLVMYSGRIIEQGPTREIINDAQHPYTQGLLSAIPKLEDDRPNHIRLKGEVPTPVNLPSGCVFHGRCPYANERCRQEVPQLITTDGGTQVACHAVEEGRL